MDINKEITITFAAAASSGTVNHDRISKILAQTAVSRIQIGVNGIISCN